MKIITAFKLSLLSILALCGLQETSAFAEVKPAVTSPSSSLQLLGRITVSEGSASGLAMTMRPNERLQLYLRAPAGHYKVGGGALAQQAALISFDLTRVPSSVLRACANMSHEFTSLNGLNSAYSLVLHGNIEERERASATDSSKGIIFRSLKFCSLELEGVTGQP